MYKIPTVAPDWIGSPSAARVHSLSGCVSGYFTDYIPHWKHNGFWLFDTPERLDQVASAASLDPQDFDLLYFEADPRQYVEDTATWELFAPNSSFATEVKPPRGARLLGYDVMCFSCGTSPECSPVTCCGLARKARVNGACLLRSAQEARELLESGLCNNTEPGPFRIISVSLVREAGEAAAQHLSEAMWGET